MHLDSPTQQASSVVTVRLKRKVKNDLDALCKSTKRTRSFLAAEAIEAYVAQEVAIIRGVQRGRADIEAGRVVSHQQAMKQLDAAIEKVARRKQ